MSVRLSKIVVAGAAAALLCAGSVYVIASAAQDATPSTASSTNQGTASASVESIVSVTLPVTDLDRSVKYYVNQLGFKVLKDGINDNGLSGRSVVLSTPWNRGGASVILTDAPNLYKPGALRGLFWEVTDCASTVAALRLNGAEVGDCQDAPSGPLADLADPDGNVWTLATCAPEVQAVNGLATVSVSVSNQDASKDFYVNVLGFTVLKDRPNPGGFPGRYIELAPPGGGPTLVLSVWWDEMPVGASRVNLTTGDYRGFVAKLQASGVSTADTASGGTFSDPDGNVWTVTQG